jgi:hypothetical protein
MAAKRRSSVTAAAVTASLLAACGAHEGPSIIQVQRCISKSGASVRLITEVDAEAKEWPHRLLVHLRDGTGGLVAFFVSASAAKKWVGQVRGAYFPVRHGSIGTWYFNRPSTTDQRLLQSCIR